MAPEGKIKSKDLSYTSDLPPFLQRLHAQKAGQGDQDRHEREIARPKRVKNDDEDDGPTMLDESGETVSKEEYEKLTAAPQEDENVKGEVLDSEPKASGAIPDGESTAQQKVTHGAATKKRKVGKVVGEDDDGDASVKKDGVEAKKATKKPKKKAKAVKLAFNDDQDEGT